MQDHQPDAATRDAFVAAIRRVLQEYDPVMPAAVSAGIMIAIAANVVRETDPAWSMRIRELASAGLTDTWIMLGTNDYPR